MDALENVSNGVRINEILSLDSAYISTFLKEIRCFWRSVLLMSLLWW